MIDLVNGEARPLTPRDVETVAGYLGVEIAVLNAVMKVESNGKPFEGKRPIILNEPHIFYRRLNSEQCAKAVNSGLAYAKWKTKPYPKLQKDRYVWLDKAVKINETAALESCSWGMGQIMGFNHKAAGFETVQEFVDANFYSAGAQLYAMARFIVSSKLTPYLRSKEWAKFARGYNGKAYKENRYDVLLAKAYRDRPQSERRIPSIPTQEQIDQLTGEF